MQSLDRRVSDLGFDPPSGGPNIESELNIKL